MHIHTHARAQQVYLYDINTRVLRVYVQQVVAAAAAREFPRTAADVAVAVPDGVNTNYIIIIIIARSSCSTYYCSTTRPRPSFCTHRYRTLTRTRVRLCACV